MAVSGDTFYLEDTDTTAVPPLSPRPRRGGIVTLLAGVGMGLMSLLPWLSSPFGTDPTGWDLFDAARDAGQNPFWTTELFADQFSLFFSGPAAVVSGALMCGAALAVILAPKLPQPAKTTVPTGWAVGAQSAGFIGGALPVISLYTLGVVQREPKLIDPGAGLFGWAAMAAVGFLALVIACAGKRTAKTQNPAP